MPKVPDSPKPKESLLTFSLLVYCYSFTDLYQEKFSAAEIQRQLGHKRYEPIWLMLHKLRSAMGKRDELYSLSGAVGLDEGFFTTERDEQDKDRPLKRGRGSQRKTTVVVMAESTPVEGEKTKKGKPRKVGHIKMVVVNNLKSPTIDKVVKENVDKGAIIDSDDSTSYTNLKTIVKEHNPKVVPPKEAGKMLPWVHIAISNAKPYLIRYLP